MSESSGGSSSSRADAPARESHVTESCTLSDALFMDAASAESDYVTFRALLDADYAEYGRRKQALGASMVPSGQFVRRLRALDTGSSYSRKLKCLRPAQPLESLERRHSFDRELLGLKLRRGRVCQHALCLSLIHI